MSSTITRLRNTALMSTAATVVAADAIAAPAKADGVTPDQLTKAGWTCTTDVALGDRKRVHTERARGPAHERRNDDPRA